MSEMVYGTTIGKEITYEKLFKMSHSLEGRPGAEGLFGFRSGEER